MKRICFFGCDFQMGGASGVTVNLINELCKKYSVYMVAAYDNENTAYGKDNVAPCVKYHNFGIDNISVLKNRKKVLPLFEKFLKENDIDIVYAVGYYAAFYIAPIIRRNKKCKYVYIEHGAPANQISDKKGTIMRMISVRAHDITVALTKRSEHDFVKLIKANPKKVITIHNWVVLNEEDRSIKYDISCKKLLSVGRLASEKGFDMLADIASDVLKGCPDWEWHIIGDGPDREKFEAKIAEYGLENNIVMHGAVTDAVKCFGEYSVMVLTSYREGLPLVLLEAKSKKLPCVSFDVVTGPAEIIRDGVNGYLIPPYDKKLFADRLCELMENDSLRQSFSDNAYLDIEKFEKDEILGQWIDLTERLTAEKSKNNR